MFNFLQDNVFFFNIIGLWANNFQSPEVAGLLRWVVGHAGLNSLVGGSALALLMGTLQTVCALQGSHLNNGAKSLILKPLHLLCICDIARHVIVGIRDQISLHLYFNVCQ